MAEFNDKTDELFRQGLKLEIYHIPSDTTVAFKAFITDLSDDFKQNWNEETVIGRSDPFHNFENTSRTINISWSIVAHSIGEARKNLTKMSLLSMMNYPKYDQGIEQTFQGVQNATSITEAPMFRVKLMNLITAARSDASSPSQGVGEAKQTGLPCRTDGFAFTHTIDDGYFADKIEGATADNSVVSLKVYPKTINASCTLHVIHDHALGWSLEKQFRGGGLYPYDERVIMESDGTFLDSEPIGSDDPILSEEHPEDRDETSELLEKEIRDARLLNILGNF